MKKFIYSMFAMALVAMTFASCADVPAPYDNPNDNPGDGQLEEGTYLSESFATSFGTFEVNTVKGTPWTLDFNCATATGYDNASKITTASDSYLVSPEVDLAKSTGAFLQFDYILRFANQGIQTVLITDNYTGDPTTTTWTDITGTLLESSSYTDFKPYGYNIPVEFIGKAGIVVALHFATAGTAEAPTSGTWEVQNLLLKEGQTTGGGVIGEGTGSGTAEDPYDVIAAINIAQKASNTPDGDVYVKGKVVSVDATSFDPAYGSLIYYISNDGTATNQFEIYRGLGLGGEKFAAADGLKPGDDVVILGGIVNYNGTLEITSNSKLVSLNGEGGTISPPVLGEGDGTEANPYDVTSIIALATASKVWVKGYIVGSISGRSPETGSVFNADPTLNSTTNILIALSPDETDFTKCVPIQLPKNAIRTGLALNPAGNEANYKQEIVLYGDIATYFQMPGLMNPTYAVVGSTEFGTHP